jgi:hypothetical protein
MGEPFKNGSPWSEPRKAASPTHSLLRKGKPHPGPKLPDLSYQRGILLISS